MYSPCHSAYNLPVIRHLHNDWIGYAYHPWLTIIAAWDFIINTQLLAKLLEYKHKEHRLSSPLNGLVTFPLGNLGDMRARNKLAPLFPSVTLLFGTLWFGHIYIYLFQHSSPLPTSTIKPAKKLILISFVLFSFIIFEVIKSGQWDICQCLCCCFHGWVEACAHDKMAIMASTSLTPTCLRMDTIKSLQIWPWAKGWMIPRDASPDTIEQNQCDWNFLLPVFSWRKESKVL